MFLAGSSLRLIILKFSKKSPRGLMKSPMTSRLLWSISSGSSKQLGPPQASQSLSEWREETSVSLTPCRRKVGHLTPLMVSMFRNLSWIRFLVTRPSTWSFTMSFIDVFALIKTKEAGLYFCARKHAGPLPMLLPHTISSESGIWSSFVKNL